MKIKNIFKSKKKSKSNNKINFYYYDLLVRNKLEPVEGEFYRALKIVLKNCKLHKYDIEISLSFKSSEQMKDIYFKHCKKHHEPDMLSFEFNEHVEGNRYDLGDILINYDLTRSKNPDDKDFAEKLIKNFIHSLLHLIGFTHEKLLNWKVMSNKERKYFSYYIKIIEKEKRKENRRKNK